jgi:uncharacterized protein involved in exopolysaccharide biosynthesis
MREISFLLRRHFLIAAGILLTTYGITAFLIFRAERVYEVSTTLLPKIGGDMDGGSGLMSLARNFGLAGGQKSADISALYETMIKSRRMAEKLLSRNFQFGENRDVSLYEIFEVDTSKGKSRPKAQFLKKFSKSVTVETMPISGVTVIRFSSVDPVFGAEFLNTIVVELAHLVEEQ